MDHRVLLETPRSKLIVWDGYIDKENSKILKDHIETLPLISNPQFKIGGKSATMHRSIGFFSDESEGYRYSRQIAVSQRLTETLKMTLNQINDVFKADFNGILINVYHTGDDYIGAHSDDETSLSNVGVVAVSLGATRTFRVRNIRTKERFDFPLEDGQLLWMAGDFQSEFTHEVPVSKRVQEKRISLTFRKHLV
jgi:alkylated DNA repair dioxygenase AlkB